MLSNSGAVTCFYVDPSAGRVVMAAQEGISVGMGEHFVGGHYGGGHGSRRFRGKQGSGHGSGGHTGGGWQGCLYCYC